MQISIAHELEKIKKTLNTTGTKVFKPSLNAALNKVGVKQTNIAAVEVAKVQRVKQKLVKDRVVKRRSNFRTLTYQAIANYRGITWYSLGAKTGSNRSKFVGVKAGTGANAHIHKRAFIARSRKSGNMQVFARVGKSRYPLRVLRVRLFEPFNRAFDSRLKVSKKAIIEELEKQLEWRTKKELKKSES